MTTEAQVSATCPGVLVWYECTGGAVLHCSHCGHITVTGNWNDAQHALADVLMEGC